MHIRRHSDFTEHLFEILDYIARDNFSASLHFLSDLNDHIRHIVDFPYQHRRSIYFDDDTVRDMIFHGYTIVYEIHPEEDLIEILDIFNRNKP